MVYLSLRYKIRDIKSEILRFEILRSEILRFEILRSEILRFEILRFEIFKILDLIALQKATITVMIL